MVVIRPHRRTHTLATSGVLAAAGALLVATAGACSRSDAASSADGAAPAAAKATAREGSAALTAVSPPTVSNQTVWPLLVYGKNLATGQRLHVGAPFDVDVPLVVDAPSGAPPVTGTTRAHALLPPLSLPPSTPEVRAAVTLVGADASATPLSLVVVNDVGFVDVTAFAASADGRYAFAASMTTDEVYALDTADGSVRTIVVGDGPSALAVAELDGGPRLVVAHRFSPELRVLDVEPATDGSRRARSLRGPAHARALLVHARVAYVGEHARDQLVAVDLATGAERWRVDVAPNPGGIALVPGGVAVGSLVAGEIDVITLDGRAGPRIAPRPGVEIVGGHTAPYASAVVGGKGVRALAAAGGEALLVASMGPNVGPNADAMGETGTGGIGVVVQGRYARHVALNAGVPQALAVSSRGLAFVADVGEGRVHVFDVARLLGDGRAARAALLGSVPLPPPVDAPLVRARDDFGEARAGDEAPRVGEDRPRRAGPEVHTGPSALAVSADGRRLLVLERFTGRVTLLAVDGNPRGAAKTALPRVERSWTLFGAWQQRERRLGQVLYFADLGRTGMSCDACHLEGHTEGVFFTKTGMMRLWRSSTIRGARDTPPFFNPPTMRTLAETCAVVGGRNRYQNPPLTSAETAALAAYTQSLTTLPNPFRASDGGLADVVALDGGRTGRPHAGAAIFAARCETCHAPPSFAADRFLHVDTPPVLELRTEQQDVSFTARTPPSLVGAWDNWPMLVSGAAGFAVVDDHLEARDHSALRAVLERASPGSHGGGSELDEVARADLEAFVSSL